MLPDSVREALPLGGEAAVVLTVLLLGVTAVHFLLYRVAVRIAQRTSGLDAGVVRCTSAPVLGLMYAAAVVTALPVFSLEAGERELIRRLLGLAIPGLLGWLAIRLLGSIRGVIEYRSDISVADNLRARRRRTRAAILHRVGVMLIAVTTLCMMLMTIPTVRAVGLTLFASAGIAGLALAAAAQPALKNIIAGIQLAFTEPVRIDDVVIIDGEWGRIEQIRLTYVVVRLWDERRLVVPVSRFLESSFENWTRDSANLLGPVSFFVDPAAKVGAIRDKFIELARASPHWDGRHASLVVVDLRPGAMELRGLVSARDAGQAFELRCELREALTAFIRDSQPQALVRTRAELVDGGRQPQAAARNRIPEALDH